MLGYLATVMITAIENAVVVGGLSALGAAHFSVGVPKDSVIQYETALKADNFLLMAHGPAAEIDQAKAILAATSPSRLDVHAAGKAAEVSGNPGHAARRLNCEALQSLLSATPLQFLIRAAVAAHAGRSRP